MEKQDFELECLTREMERGQINASTYYRRYANFFSKDSEQYKQHLLKSDWAFEREVGFTNLPFRLWKQLKEVNKEGGRAIK